MTNDCGENFKTVRSDVSIGYICRFRFLNPIPKKQPICDAHSDADLTKAQRVHPHRNDALIQAAFPIGVETEAASGRDQLMGVGFACATRTFTPVAPAPAPELALSLSDHSHVSGKPLSH